MKLAQWPLMGGLLHLIQRKGDWAGPQPAQAPPRCTKCNNPRIISITKNECHSNIIVFKVAATLKSCKESVSESHSSRVV